MSHRAPDLNGFICRDGAVMCLNDTVVVFFPPFTLPQSSGFGSAAHLVPILTVGTDTLPTRTGAHIQCIENAAESRSAHRCVGARLTDRRWDSSGSVLGYSSMLDLELSACSTSGTKKPVWVYPWCLQLCCFFTLLAKSCPNTHSTLSSSTWGCTMFFHSKSCPWC